MRFFFSFTKRKEEQNKFTTMSIKEQMLVPKKYLHYHFFDFLMGYDLWFVIIAHHSIILIIVKINYSASHTPAASAHYILYFLTLLLFL